MNKQLRFDLKADLDKQAITLDLSEACIDVPEKSVVVFLPGMRAMGHWHFSTSLGGAYQYIPSVSRGDSISITLEGVDSFLRNGLPVAITTFGSLRHKNVSEVFASVTFSVDGFDFSTCEPVTIAYSAPANDDDRKSVELESRLRENRYRDLENVKSSPIVNRAYNELKRRLPDLRLG